MADGPRPTARGGSSRLPWERWRHDRADAHPGSGAASGRGHVRLALDTDGNPTRKVVFSDFEANRHEVEAVSVRFRLFDRHRGPLRLGHEGVFEVEWPGDERQRSLIRSHFGARRFAKNWAIALVKADLEAKKRNPDHASVPWTLDALRTCWNQESTRSPPGGPRTPRSATPQGSPTPQPRSTTGRSRSEVCARDEGWGSLASSPGGLGSIGSGSPPGPCASRMTGVRSRFR
jgi:hypothetical protein